MSWLPGLPPPASAHAGAIDFVLGLEHWGMLAIFTGFLAYLAFVLIYFRQGARPQASYAGMSSHWSVYVVLAIVLCEGVLLVAYEMPEWRERVLNVPSEREATVVRVVAGQYQWNVHYPGNDGRFGRTAVTLVSPRNPVGLDRDDPDAKDDVLVTNQLTVPVNRPVVIHLTSLDVVHSFGVAEMRVKQDAVPGTDTPVWFKPTVTTAEMRRRLGRPEYEYEITCSQLCGQGHYRMRGYLTVTTEDEYRSFLAAGVGASGR